MPEFRWLWLQVMQKKQLCAIAKEAGILKDEKTEVVLTHDDSWNSFPTKNLRKNFRCFVLSVSAKPLDKKRLVTIGTAA